MIDWLQERDFDHHVRYCRDQPDAIKLLDDPKVKDFFDVTAKIFCSAKLLMTMGYFFQKIAKTADPNGKSLLDYLKLPIERLEQYQLCIKVINHRLLADEIMRRDFVLWIPQELIKYTARADLETKSLQRALELMLSIPQRANDLAYIRNIHEFPGDTVKLGRLLRHVWNETNLLGQAEMRLIPSSL